MKTFDLMIRLVFIGTGITIALINARELLVAWYSGSDPGVTPFQKTMLFAECVLLLITTVFVSMITLRG